MTPQPPDQPSPCAALWVGVQLQLRHHNGAAAQLLARADAPLYLHQGRLHARHAERHARLQQAVARVLPGKAAAQALALPQASGSGSTWTLRVTRSTQAGQALLLLRDPAQTQVDAALLQDLFGLTSAEATVAAALCHGDAPADIAQALQVQPNTVQAHLKKALAKTGTRRQAQLVALLLRSVAACGTSASPPGHG